MATTGQGITLSIGTAVAGLKSVKRFGVSVTKVQSDDASQNYKGYIPGQFEYKDVEATLVYSAATLAAMIAAAGDATKSIVVTGPDGSTYTLAAGSFVQDVDEDVFEKDKESVFKIVITQNGPGAFAEPA